MAERQSSMVCCWTDGQTWRPACKATLYWPWSVHVMIELLLDCGQVLRVLLSLANWVIRACIANGTVVASVLPCEHDQLVSKRAGRCGQAVPIDVMPGSIMCAT